MPAIRRARATVRAAATTAALTAALSASLAVAAAQPAAAAAPVAVDDHVTMYAGSSRLVDVLRNDSDADAADDLTICRVADPGQHGDYYADVLDGRLLVAITPGATGTRTITYYACDYQTLVPATLTVTVREVEPVEVTTLARPGLLRVTNRNDRPVRFLFGSRAERRPDGRVVVPAHRSAVVRVHRHHIFYVALMGRMIRAGRGNVRGIELPAGDHAPSPRAQLDRSDARTWATQR